MSSVRHVWFLVAFAASIVAALVAYAAALPGTTCILIGADTCFALYLALDLLRAARLTPATLRANVTAWDEGVPLILLLALATVIVSLTAIVMVLQGASGGGGTGVEAALALATIPLGWGVLHVMAAWHYAYLYHKPAAPGTTGAGGLEFPGEAFPGVGAFLYFSFTIAMTAQVSDVPVTRPALRKAVLIHAIGSFFYNTCILALAVSAALTLGR